MTGILPPMVVMSSEQFIFLYWLAIHGLVDRTPEGVPMVHVAVTRAVSTETREAAEDRYDEDGSGWMRPVFIPQDCHRVDITARMGGVPYQLSTELMFGDAWAHNAEFTRFLFRMFLECLVDGATRSRDVLLARAD